MTNSISDLMVACVSPVIELEKSTLDNCFSIKVGGRYYYRHWNYISSHEVIWYEFRLPNDDSGFGTDIINDYDEGLHCLHQHTSFISDIENAITPFNINNKYISKLLECIKTIIHSSSVKTVFFIVRYQSREYEIVQGMYHLDDFEAMLRKGFVFSNVCYIITL